ncbi:MAG: alpha/beta hydrolase [Desulfobacterales bacterium]|nr:alpha/beta hydrolase [Desulfobacterales bacterium]
MLHLPDRKRPPIVIGSHGLLSNKNSPKQIALAHKCNEFGIAYFRFDYRGCGESQGNYSKDTSFETRCEDLMNAVKTLQTRNDIGNRIGLFGSSLGGAVSIAAAGTIHIDSLVTFAAPIRSRELSAPVEISGNQSTTSNNTHGIKLQFDISNNLSSISHILIIHGENDVVVPLSHARQIYNSVNNPKKLIIQEKGDHAMSNETHQEDFIIQASQWLKTGLVSNL